MALGVALATLAVALAVVYQYTITTRPQEEEIRLEDFSWWVDVVEPAADLKNLKAEESGLAARIVSSDLKNLSKNSDLLNRRLALLIGRRDFEGLSEEDYSGEARKVANSLSELAQGMERRGAFQQGFYRLLEQHASRLDRVANKLYEFEREKPETICVYVDPLRRASEKLSRDLRRAASNVFKFEKRMKPSG
jgi:chromosome segregation ATPase